MKVTNLIFTGLFIVSAGLQFNDPDPYLWVPIYLTGAFFCIQAFRGVFYPKSYLLVSSVFALYAFYLFFERYGVMDWLTKHQGENIATSMKASSPWIENTREFFGLAILITIFLLNYFTYRSRKF